MNIFLFLFSIFLIIVLIIVLSLNVSYFAELRGKRNINISEDKVNAGFWLNLILLILVILIPFFYFIWYLVFRREPGEDAFSEMINGPGAPAVLAVPTVLSTTATTSTSACLLAPKPAVPVKVAGVPAKVTGVFTPRAETYGGNIYYPVPQPQYPQVQARA